MTDKMEKIFAEIHATLDGIKADNEASNRRREILKKNVWDIEELALYLRRSVDRVRRMAHGRVFPSYKQNGSYYFKREEIEAWLTENRIKSVDETNAQASLYTLKKRK
ncbi:helix-turn-helix domain-containing protein [Barnesiella propionica]|uniref:helix-turn-helix domain-containing protein n=1 Tax=Barnesiella propionica TaxID=2981781 RepID=UPI0011C97BAC|nr:helix-turn-helix domain-containing protein [Barnesiella propionica]MCU6767389.1 helix-turn-helix domain-containing protein [Barnesiella propionica]